MTSSRSIPKWLVVLAALVIWVGHASAERKRVVVLEFDGPNASKFRSAVIKVIKKKHSVIKDEKWSKTAEELDAAKVTEKNVKKIAKKLKIDGLITGKVDKRRDEYIIKIRLRAGTTGEYMGNAVQIKADGPRLDDRAERDIKDELVAVIDELEKNRGGGSDEDAEDAPKKRKGDDAVGEEPRKSGFSRNGDDSEDEPRGDDEVAEDDKPKKRAKKSDDDEDGERRRKRKASSDDDDDSGDGIEDSVEVTDEDEAKNLSPAFRAVDAVIGLSFTRRNLSFTSASDLADKPPGYKQSIPVAGALIDVTVYPMSIGHKRRGIIEGIGLNLVYDQVLIINSQKSYSADGMPAVANLETKESRFSIGGVFRYPLGKGARAPVVGGSLSYGKQKFTVAQELPNMEATDIPNVAYTMFSPAAFFRYPVIPKVSLNLDAAFHAITNTGAIQTRTQYGAATVSGYTVVLGADYMITKNIFARAGIRYQAIGFTFKGDPMAQSNTRDTDPEQDVTAAKDSYFGGSATVGYAF